MKKPLTLVPPAQAEALYDAALLNAPRGRGPSAPAFVAPPCLKWDTPEWGEDDAPTERERAALIPNRGLPVSIPNRR